MSEKYSLDEAINEARSRISIEQGLAQIATRQAIFQEKERLEVQAEFDTGFADLMQQFSRYRQKYSLSPNAIAYKTWDTLLTDRRKSKPLYLGWEVYRGFLTEQDSKSENQDYHCIFYMKDGTIQNYHGYLSRVYSDTLPWEEQVFAPSRHNDDENVKLSRGHGIKIQDKEQTKKILNSTVLTIAQLIAPSI